MSLMTTVRTADFDRASFGRQAALRAGADFDDPHRTRILVGRQTGRGGAVEGIGTGFAEHSTVMLRVALKIPRPTVGSNTPATALELVGSAHELRDS